MNFSLDTVINFYKITKIVREKLVNHFPSARDLEAFLVFSQHPAWVIKPAGKPIESVVYCLSKLL